MKYLRFLIYERVYVACMYRTYMHNVHYLKVIFMLDSYKIDQTESSNSLVINFMKIWKRLNYTGI